MVMKQVWVVAGDSAVTAQPKEIHDRCENLDEFENPREAMDSLSNGLACLLLMGILDPSSTLEKVFGEADGAPGGAGSQTTWRQFMLDLIFHKIG